MLKSYFLIYYHVCILKERGDFLFSILEELKVKDLDSYTHSIRVANIAYRFAKYIKYPLNLNLVYKAGLFHDIGKLLIPNDILKNEGPFNSDQYKIMALHTRIGYNYLIEANIFPLEICYVALYHHNGGFYDKREPLPDYINTLIDLITICDIFDALISKRCYKEPYSIEKSFSILEKNPYINKSLLEQFKEYVYKSEVA